MYFKFGRDLLSCYLIHFVTKEHEARRNEVHSFIMISMERPIYQVFDV